jgi:hypothetical protein
MSWRHPSDEQLARWVQDGTGQRAQRHAVQCPFCERRLDALTELAPQLRQQLAASVEPGEAFAQRLQERLDQRLFDQETLAVLTDLADVGPETTRLLLAAEERDEDDDG